MSDAVDDDTLAALRAKWMEDGADLPTLVYDPPKAGRLKSPQPMPYPHLASKPGKHVRMTGGVRIDKRLVTITVWGSKEQVELTLGVVLEIFATAVTLTYPTGAKYLA